MRVPSFNHYPRFLQGFALFLSGLVTGCALYMAMHHHHFNMLYVQFHKSQEENAKLVQDMESLVKYRYKQSKIALIQVHLTSQSGEHDFSEDIQEEIERVVQKELKAIIGQNATHVKEAHWLYEKLISQQVYVIHGKQLDIAVKSIVLIGNELSVWITAQETVDFPR
jgi:hypothetical protein